MTTATWQWQVLADHRDRIEDNFWPKVDIAFGCWEWRATHNRHGYGMFSLNVGGRTKSYYAHRLMMMLLGYDPGESVDHLCRNRGCVNPAHLESVPLAVNKQRGNLRWRSELTHCKRGHEFTVENTYVYRGHRTCRACGVEKQRRYLVRKGGQ